MNLILTVDFKQGKVHSFFLMSLPPSMYKSRSMKTTFVIKQVRQQKIESEISTTPTQ